MREQLPGDTVLVVGSGAADSESLESTAPGMPRATPVDGSWAADPERLLRDDRIGPFTIERFIGRGGMGAVYCATDTRLSRHVAIKFVLGEFAGSAGSDRRARLDREARALARLSHSNVVQVFEVGEHAGNLYVVMEYVDGATLSVHLRGLESGPARWRDVVTLMVGAAEGLAAAHDAGLVHRDFKPDNVMVEHNGRVRVMDFGLARGTTSSSPSEAPATTPAIDLALTQTGALIGTPAYMSPEQLRGTDIDARSDQFAFCVVLYEAIARRRPFVATSLPELVDVVLNGPPPDLGAIAAPAEITRAIGRGLSRDPDQRFASMNDLVVVLKRALAEPTTRRSIVGRVLVGLSAAALASVAVWMVRRQLDPALADTAQAAPTTAITGTIDRAQIQQVMEANIDDVQTCYEEALSQDPATIGRVAIHGVIGPAGNLESASVVDNSAANPFLGSCIAAKMMTWRFPLPEGGSAEFIYPFVLEPR